MADVYAISGDVYIAPTTATVGGVKFEGLDQSRPIRLIAPHGLAMERHGFERDAVQSYQTPAGEPCQLVLPAAGHDAQTLKIAFATMTLDGATIQSAGGNALRATRLARSVAAVVRPRDASHHYWYFPALQLHTDAIGVMNRSAVEFAGIDDSLLTLLCGRPIASLQDAAFIGTPDDINAHYSLGTGTPLIELVPPYAHLPSTIEGEAGVATTYRIEAWNLVSNLFVGPVAGVQFGIEGNDGSFASTLELEPQVGRVSLVVWVRFSESATAGSIVDFVPHVSTGAVTQQLLVFGDVEPAEEEE